MLTYFLCFLGGKSVVFKLENALFFHPIHMERLKVQFHGLYAGSTLSHRIQEYYLQGQNAVVQQNADTFLFLLFFSTCKDPLIEYWVEL